MIIFHNSSFEILIGCKLYLKNIYHNYSYIIIIIVYKKIINYFLDIKLDIKYCENKTKRKIKKYILIIL